MHLRKMSHILVGLHHNTHGGQDVPALVRYGHHCAAIPICLDFLPVGRSHNDRTRNAVALWDVSEILHDRASDDLQELLTVIGNDLPVLDTQRSNLTNVNMNWNHPLGHFQQQDGCGRRHDRQAYAFPRYPP